LNDEVIVNIIPNVFLYLFLKTNILAK